VRSAISSAGSRRTTITGTPLRFVPSYGLAERSQIPLAVVTPPPDRRARAIQEPTEVGLRPLTAGDPAPSSSDVAGQSAEAGSAPAHGRDVPDAVPKEPQAVELVAVQLTVEILVRHRLVGRQSRRALRSRARAGCLRLRSGYLADFHHGDRGEVRLRVRRCAHSAPHFALRGRWAPFRSTASPCASASIDGARGSPSLASRLSSRPTCPSRASLSTARRGRRRGHRFERSPRVAARSDVEASAVADGSAGRGAARSASRLCGSPSLSRHTARMLARHVV